MWVQLFLDVQNFRQQLSEFGIDPNNFEPFQTLWAKVQPAEVILNKIRQRRKL